MALSRMNRRGCPRPAPDLWSETRRAMQSPHGRILFAHSDMSVAEFVEDSSEELLPNHFTLLWVGHGSADRTHRHSDCML